MKLILTKSLEVENTYPLTYGGVVLSTYKGTDKKKIVETALAFAKATQKDVVVCQSFFSDYFIGFQKSFKNPVIFKDSEFVSSNYETQVAFFEGPFPTIEAAQSACFSLCGEKGELADVVE